MEQEGLDIDEPQLLCMGNNGALGWTEGLVPAGFIDVSIGHGCVTLPQGSP